MCIKYSIAGDGQEKTLWVRNSTIMLGKLAFSAIHSGNSRSCLKVTNNKHYGIDANPRISIPSLRLLKKNPFLPISRSLRDPLYPMPSSPVRSCSRERLTSAGSSSYDIAAAAANCEPLDKLQKLKLEETSRIEIDTTIGTESNKKEEGIQNGKIGN
jgi:hypothetical protein